MESETNSNKDNNQNSQQHEENNHEAEQNHQQSQNNQDQQEQQNKQQETSEVHQSQASKSTSKKVETPKMSTIKNKNQESIKKDGDLWKAYDFLFPGGKLSKLIKIFNIYKKNLPIYQMLKKFKYNDAYPVINIIGGMENNRGKFYAGIARAAHNTDAVILTNGIATGLEKFVLRRSVKMIGIAPQKQVKFPKINPTFVQKMQLANGHSHIFLLNNSQKDLGWGGQVQFKINVALKLAQGKKKNQPNCKIVSLLVGDALFQQIQQIKKSVQNQFPVVVVPGSPLCDELIKNSADPRNSTYSNQQLEKLVQKGHFFYCNTTNSQDIAQLVHLLLVIRPW